MSRSFRKTAKYTRNDKDYKRLANKKARKYDIDSGGAHKKLGYTYDICDYRAVLITDDDMRSAYERGGLRYLIKGYAK